MLFAALGDIDVDINIEETTSSLEELRQDYSERFFTQEGLELLRSAGMECAGTGELELSEAPY